MLNPCLARAAARPVWRGAMSAAAGSSSFTTSTYTSTSRSSLPFSHTYNSSRQLRPKNALPSIPIKRLRFASTKADAHARAAENDARKAEARPRDILAEAKNITAQQQRTADWGIIKEMGKYIWPKVGGPVYYVCGNIC